MKGFIFAGSLVKIKPHHIKMPLPQEDGIFIFKDTRTPAEPQIKHLINPSKNLK